MPKRKKSSPTIVFLEAGDQNELTGFKRKRGIYRDFCCDEGNNDKFSLRGDCVNVEIS